MGEFDDFLTTTIARQIEAERAIHNGDGEPRMEMWSSSDPVTCSELQSIQERVATIRRSIRVLPPKPDGIVSGRGQANRMAMNGPADGQNQNDRPASEASEEES